MKYIGYARKSSEEDSKQVQSLDTQKRILQDYALKESLEVVEYIFESKSARTDGNRPLFTSMLERIKSGEADAILVVHPDRLARNMIELGMITKLKQLGFLKEIRTPMSSYSTTADLFKLELEGTFASQYSRDLSDKVNAGIKSKLLRGEYLSQAPLGYVNTPQGIIPDSARAPYIKQAFKRYAVGDISLKSLSNELYEQGFRTKGGRKAYRSVIERMLKNRVYYGVLFHKGVLYPATHEPLVSKELFDSVQDVLVGRNRSKKQKNDFLYRDYLYCHVCGCKMTATTKKGKYNYYYCTNGKGNCEEHTKYIEEKNLHKKFLPVFEAINLDEELATLSLEIYAEELKNQSSLQEKIQESVQEQIRGIEKKLEKSKQLYLNELSTLEEYKKDKQDFENQKVDLQLALRQKGQSAQTTLELLQQFKKYACTMQKMFEEGDDKVKADLLRSALWNSEMEGGEIVSTRYRKPYTYLLEMNKTRDIHEWRRWRDSNPRNR